MTTLSASARGLGYQHRKQRDALLNAHVDGSPCFWCGLPMWLDAERNWDEAGLEADHIIPRSIEHSEADRLLHQWCNRKRGDGRHDDWRPAVTGEPMLRSVVVSTMPVVDSGVTAPTSPRPGVALCAVCGSPFRPNKSVRTCGRKCGRELQRRNRKARVEA